METLLQLIFAGIGMGSIYALVALGLVLILSGIFTVQKGDPVVWPIAAVVAGMGFALILMAPRWYQHFRPPEAIAAEQRAAGKQPPEAD